MQRMNRMVLGLIAVFVLGGRWCFLVVVAMIPRPSPRRTPLLLLGCRQYTFNTETDFNVTVSSTLGFNGDASRFAPC